MMRKVRPSMRVMKEPSGSMAQMTGQRVDFRRISIWAPYRPLR